MKMVRENCIFSSNLSSLINIFIKFSFIILILLQYSFSLEQKSEEIKNNPCNSQKTCKDCIQAGVDCAWCMHESFSNNKARCDYHLTLSKTGCPKNAIIFPTNFVKVIETRNFSDQAAQANAVQLRPNRVALKLRPKATMKFELQFREALDYPVDLYYLMDLSKSMEDDKDKLAILGNQLADEMIKLTKNFRLGFGSFVDKTVMPYISTVPAKRNRPCKDCVAPYGFKNHMPLNTNSEVFTTKVRETSISGNLDAPEGGFDAIMQSIVCPQEIGWRNGSRKLIVFSTDSGFHYAGDGKLGGIVKPNDGHCHMRNNEYTESTNQDYPSISQINQKLIDNHMHLIFAVTAPQFDVYDRLRELITGSSAGRLENDSSNIVDLVKAQYLKIKSSVKLKSEYDRKHLKVEFFSQCLGNKLEERGECDGLPVGTKVNFEARVTVLKCPESRSQWNQTIKIYPYGISEELIVDLQMLCECDCEKEWAVERNSPKCDGMGTYQCGICKCNENRYGAQCRCNTTSDQSSSDEMSCRQPNTTVICSLRGECFCGKCQCKSRSETERIYGEFCQCDNFSCKRASNVLCNGHGDCDCGVCKCHDEWSGDDCSCHNSTVGCINPKTKTMCSGHGTCQCNVCRCDATPENQFYTGTYCEKCPTCPKTKCEKLKDCVRCSAYHTGPLKDSEECFNNSTKSRCYYKTIVKDKLELTESEDERVCFFVDEDDGCQFRFRYEVLGDDDIKPLSLIAERAKDCPKPINILAIVIGVIVGVVLVGLAILLMWKLLTTIHDRREFAKFEKEREMAKWDTGENPIYKQATTTFKNPTYGGKQ